MKIKSNYYDIYDYLQDFGDDRVFLRRESTIFAEVMDWNSTPIKYKFWKDTDNRPLAKQINTKFYCTPNVYENPNLFDSVKEEMKKCKMFGHPAEFFFIPTNLRIPIKVYVRTNPENIVIKEYERDNPHRTIGGEILGQENEFFNQFNVFCKETYKSSLWKSSVKPISYIVMRDWDGKYSQMMRNLIWINPPLAMIPNLLNYFKSSEEIYQEIEQYLWNDVELKNPMESISNEDRIIGHGFDLKDSFRNVK